MKVKHGYNAVAERRSFSNLNRNKLKERKKLLSKKKQDESRRRQVGRREKNNYWLKLQTKQKKLE